ncbi:O-antigen ligase family protein [Candidatus Peregrinibacteria bacterium]|nr:O-antigen ligase family protein [Candidatus Peregrinibacteria bacterium]
MINHIHINKKLQNLGLATIIRLILYGLILTLPSVFYLRFSQNFQFPKTVFFQITIDVLLLLSFFFIIRHKTISFPKNEPFLMLTMTMLIVSFFASAVFSIAPRISFWGNIFNNEGLFQTLHLSAWFLLLYVFFEKNHFVTFLETIVISALFPSFVAIGQHIWNKNFFLPLGDELVGRSIGTLGHPNFLGQFLALALIINIFLLLQYRPTFQDKIYLISGTASFPALKNWDFRLNFYKLTFLSRRAFQLQQILQNIFQYRWIFFYILTFTLMLVALATTGSRAGFLTFGLGTICLLSFFIKKTHQQFRVRKKYYFSKISLCIIGSAVIFATFFFIAQRFNAEGIRSLESRVVIWKSVMPAIKNMPLFGYGLDTFEFVYDRFKNPAIYEYELFTSTNNSAHNIILDIFIQRGIFGIMSLFAMIIFFLWKIYKYRSIPEAWFLFSIFFGWFSSLMFSFEVINHSVLLLGLAAFLTQFTTEQKIFTMSPLCPTPGNAFFKRIHVLSRLRYSIECKEKKFKFLKIFSRHNWKTTCAQIIKKMLFTTICCLIIFFSFFSLFINIRNIQAENALSKFLTSSDMKIKNASLKKALIFNDRQKYYLDQATSFFLQNGFYSDLSSVLARALKLNNYNSYKNFVALAIANIYLFQDMEKSVLLMETAKNLAPNEPSSYLLWGETLYSLQRYDEAIIEFEKYLSLLPPYWQWDDTLESKSFEEKEKYRKFFKIFPNFRAVFQQLFKAYNTKGNIEKTEYYRQHIAP